ncbi:hypothetical protein EYB53_012605 [Candidatus Chloroploca sp. M-50]|uniref:Uncharacterized protein n=2 Tax=Candidatus Chloroploca TaxID=1579476 RepID=A0A2H3KJE2_9CHLR|nr:MULTISPECIES: hypothetical protein [Candidatus Chloroploca]MBP1466548.1 hypothetical protein [Candidatus Chloroploca mongolica]NCC33770.1 hypothetical protein [Chloroflexia bacterium]PDV98044.1 hypothetical protein A9Q02_02890 [Candidatus Chloroploca asiatica]
MTTEELARNVQFTVDSRNNITSVVLSPDLWREVLHSLREAEDLNLVHMLQERATAGTVGIGALRWREFEEEYA